MNGGGCFKCPVNPCETSIYRGSYCAAQRAEYGLGDPQTHLDRMRFMDFEEMRGTLISYFSNNLEGCDKDKTIILVDDFLEWLQEPANGG